MATILCIDDNRNILEVQQLLLESKGVVLDFNMPGMDGNQVAQVMAQEQPTLPVVIWSGYLGEIPESLRWFAYAVLHKGDGPDVLLSVVESLVKAGARSEASACWSRRTA